MEIESKALISEIAKNGRANQIINDSDFRDSEGFLVCGICGERKERELNMNGETLIVPRLCRCGREKYERDEEERKAQEEIERKERMRKSSLIDSRLYDARFENFERGKNNENIFKNCWNYANEFDTMLDNNCGLLMWGDVGTGKSYAAACIANYLLDKGVSVIMTSFVKILEICGDEDAENNIFNRIQRVKLVIFDDLGAERGTDYALEKVYDVIDTRYRSKLPMIVTTNQRLDDMMNEEDIRYKRIYDRLFESCYPIEFTGASWRKRKAYSQIEDMGKLLNREV